MASDSRDRNRAVPDGHPRPVLRASAAGVRRALLRRQTDQPAFANGAGLLLVEGHARAGWQSEYNLRQELSGRRAAGEPVVRQERRSVAFWQAARLGRGVVQLAGQAEQLRGMIAKFKLKESRSFKNLDAEITPEMMARLRKQIAEENLKKSEPQVVQQKTKAKTKKPKQVPAAMKPNDIIKLQDDDFEKF